MDINELATIISDMPLSEGRRALIKLKKIAAKILEESPNSDQKYEIKEETMPTIKKPVKRQASR